MERVCSVCEIIEIVFRGGVDKGAEAFFEDASRKPKSPMIFADICNRLIEGVSAHKEAEKPVIAFLNAVMHDSVELVDDAEFSRSIQLIAGQALTILSWVKRGMPGASEMRLTDDPARMVSNEKYGKSFVDGTKLPKGVAVTHDEGVIGFFWRGTEKIAKLGPNVAEKLIYDRDLFEVGRDKVVMYLMDHGSYAVNQNIVEATEKKKISTTHETFFTSDLLPGSLQTTSTGAGHFQGTKVDIKRVTDGWGIQFNVRFNAKGGIEEVIAQELKTGSWALALPGYVDYMVDLNVLRFSDMSIDLISGESSGFSPLSDLPEEDLSAIKDAISQEGKMAPYAGVIINDEAYITKTRKDAPSIRWIMPLKGLSASRSFIDIYSSLSAGNIAVFIEELRAGYADMLVRPAPLVTIKLLDEKNLAEAKRVIRRQS